MEKVNLNIKKVTSVVLCVIMSVFFTTALCTKKANASNLNSSESNSTVYTCDENVRAAHRHKPYLDKIDKTKYYDGPDYVTNIEFRCPYAGLNVFYDAEIDDFFGDLNVGFTVAAIDKDGNVVARWKDGEGDFGSRTQFIMFRDDDCIWKSYDGAEDLINGPNCYKFDGKFVVESVEVKD